MATILHYIYQDDFGGGPKALWSISRQFNEVATQHIACKGKKKLTQLAADDPVTKLHEFPETSSALFFCDSIYLLCLVWKLRPDVLFVHGQRGGIVSALASYFFPKCHLVYVAHFIGMYETRNLFELVRNYLAEKITFRRHRWIVFLSEGNLRFMTLFGFVPDRYRIRLIPNSVAEMSLGQGEDGVVWSGGGQVRFLFLGRLAYQKRVDWLLLAWQHALKNGLPLAELVILGNGPLVRELHEMRADLNIAESVKFPGHVDRPDRMLATCDVVVFPSLFENHSNVPLEALAAGKPIIAMDADGVRESFADGEEGFIIPLGDWKVFGEKIVLLAADRALREQMGAKGRERATLYSHEVNGAAYRKLLREILDEI